MGEADDLVDHHERAGKLHDVAHYLRHHVALGCSLQARDYYLTREDLTGRAPLESISAVGLPRRISQHSEGEVSALHETLELLRRPLAYRVDGQFRLVERILSLTQLREMPFAEGSAEVSQENERRRSPGPKLGQRDDFARDVEDFGVWCGIPYARLIHTDFVCVYASNAWGPSSRPNPDCLKPPKLTAGSYTP